MTLEEKAENYCNYLQSEMLAYTPENPRQQRTVTLLDVEDAYIAGAKENGIQWHDLRKDSNDLPKESRNTFCVVLKNGNERLMYWSTGRTKDVVTGEHIPLDFIVRWFEIPQFEE